MDIAKVFKKKFPFLRNLCADFPVVDELTEKYDSK
jgi:hypothetical protein